MFSLSVRNADVRMINFERLPKQSQIVVCVNDFSIIWLRIDHSVLKFFSFHTSLATKVLTLNDPQNRIGIWSVSMDVFLLLSLSNVICNDWCQKQRKYWKNKESRKNNTEMESKGERFEKVEKENERTKWNTLERNGHRTIQRLPWNENNRWWIGLCFLSGKRFHSTCSLLIENHRKLLYFSLFCFEFKASKMTKDEAKNSIRDNT